VIDYTKARFTELKRGYESYYLRAAHPDGGLGVWIRYTVHRKESTTGSLWFTLFDEHEPFATKVTVPNPETGNGDWIRIAGAHISEGRASGRVPDVTWNLRFTGAPALAHLPSDWMYKAPIPRTKPVSLHPIARFDGTITVRDKEIRLERWPGMVGHNWGTQHAERWIWLHGMGFAGRDDDTWLDVVLARIDIAGRTTPWLASGAICLDGQRFRLGGPRRRRQTHVAERPDRVLFIVPGKGISVTGAADAARERFVGWVYADPDGSEHHTVNSSVADLTIKVNDQTLTAKGLAAYELGMREHDHGMPIQPFSDG
jgi:hypothetical protein